MRSQNWNGCVLFLITTAIIVQAVPRIVDLSHKQNNDSITWPGNPPYQFTVLDRGFYDNAWFVKKEC